MALTLISIPAGCLSIDEATHPDRNGSAILDHLIRFLSRCDPLPVVGIELHDDGTAVVVHGHNYLLAARALGRPTIRALVKGVFRPEQLRGFLATTGGTLLDVAAIQAAEDAADARNAMPRVWHLLYFARPLSSTEKAAFEAAMRAVFPVPEEIQFLHEDAGPLVEFQARTPVTDEHWARVLLLALCTFHDDHVAIVSHQGGRFGARS